MDTIMQLRDIYRQQPATARFSQMIKNGLIVRNSLQIACVLTNRFLGHLLTMK